MRMRKSSRCVVLLGLLALAVATEGQAQIPMERTYSVDGAFQGVGNGGVMISKGGVPTLLRVGTDTEVRLRAPGTEDYLSPGLAIQVQGKLDPQTGIIDANDVIIFANSGGPTVTTNRGSTYSFAVGPNDTKIPLMLIGQIVGVNPLQVKGGPNFRTSYTITGPSGRSNRELPVTNKVFAVDAKVNNIRVDFARALQLAREGDKTWAFVGNTSKIAHEIIIDRSEAVSMQELGIEDNKGLSEGGKKSKKKTVATKKSSKTDDKADDGDEDGATAKSEPAKSKKTKPSEKSFLKDLEDSASKLDPTQTPTKKKPKPKFEDDE